jgi:hydrogenase expression/formation protein HypC
VCLAIPGRVTEFVDASLRLATVDVAGVRRTINLSLVDTDERPAQVGDWVLIHVGFALSLVDEEEANQTLTRLQAMGADYEAELNELRESAIQ